MAQEWNILILIIYKGNRFHDQGFPRQNISERVEYIRLHSANKQSQKTHHQELCVK